MASVTVQDLDNAQLDTVTLAEVANSRVGGIVTGSPINEVVTRLGDTINSVQGQLAKLGFVIPAIDWAATISVTSNVQVYRFPPVSGEFYVAKVPVPFVTGGTFTPSNWQPLASAHQLSPVDNIAELRAITITPPDNQLYTTKGYTTIGDGDSDNYYWDPISTATDNGGSIIKAAAITTGRFISLSVKIVDAGKFGAVGDGVTDDTASIQAAVNFAVSSEIRHVFFPGGTHIISGSGINISSSIIISGVNSTVSIIKNLNGPVLTMSGAFIKAENIQFWSAGDNTIDQQGTVSQSLFDSMTIRQDSDAFSLWENNNWGYIDVRFNNCYLLHTGTATVHGFNLIETGGAINDNVWENCRVQKSGTHFFNIESTGATPQVSNTFRNITFEECNGGGIRLDLSVNFGIFNCNNWDADLNGPIIKNFYFIGGVSSGIIERCNRTAGTMDTGKFDVQLTGGGGGGVIIRNNGDITSGDPFSVDLASSGATVFNTTGARFSYVNGDGANIIDRDGPTIFRSGFKAEGGAVFNDDSAAVDFRVESNNNDSMLFINGSTDKVGIGGAPETVTHINDTREVAPLTLTSEGYRTTSQLLITGGDTATTAEGDGVFIVLNPITGRGAAAAIGCVYPASGNKDTNVSLVFYTSTSSNTLTETLRLSREGNLLASIDNTQTLGGASNRWSEVFAGNGTINTSDEHIKTLRGDGLLNDAEMRACEKLSWVIYQFNDAIAKKGAEGARYHIGMIAQQFEVAFLAEGIDPSRYGILCIDEITKPISVEKKVNRQVVKIELQKVDKIIIKNNIPIQITEMEKNKVPQFYLSPVFNEKGEPVMDTSGDEIVPLTHKMPIMEDVVETVTEHVPNGKRYGLRYAQLLALEVVYLRTKIKKIHDLLDTLRDTMRGV